MRARSISLSLQLGPGVLRELNDRGKKRGWGQISEGLLCYLGKMGFYLIVMEGINKHSTTVSILVFWSSHSRSRVEDRLEGRRPNQTKQQADDCKGLSRWHPIKGIGMEEDMGRLQGGIPRRRVTERVKRISGLGDGWCIHGDDKLSLHFWTWSETSG